MQTCINPYWKNNDCTRKVDPFAAPLMPKTANYEGICPKLYLTYIKNISKTKTFTPGQKRTGMCFIWKIKRNKKCLWWIFGIE